MKPSVSEYKSYIRELKLRMKQLAVKNKELTKLVAQSRVGSYLHGKKPRATAEDLIRAQKNVIFIQKNIRGFLARRRFDERLGKVIQETPTRAAPQKAPRRQFSAEMVANEKVMRRFEQATATKNMTPEMIFRMVDEAQEGLVPTYKFSLFVKSLGLALSPAEVNRLGYILDEDCSGSVSLKEYLLSLSAYGIAKESSTHEKLFGDQFGGRTLGQILLIKFGAILRNNNVTAERFVKLAMGDQNAKFRESAKGVYVRHFLSSLKEQARRSRTNLSLKEQHCLAKFLDIDNDCLIKREFLCQELQKVFRILEQGQVQAMQLLEKDDRKYHRHFEVLKRGLSVSAEEEDICAKLLRVLREQVIEPVTWFDSLGSFLIEEYARLEVDAPNRRIFVDQALFGSFLENKWGHKIPAKTVGEVLECLRLRQSFSLKNLDDGMFFGGDKQKVNIIELAGRLEVLLRYQQKSQLAGFRMSVFVVLLQAEGVSTREYLAQKGVGSLSKKIELFQFHLHNSAHLGFKLEDSDREFVKLDPEQRGRVRYADFVRKLEYLHQQVPSSRGVQNSQVLREKNDSVLMSNTSRATESRRKIPRKSRGRLTQSTSTRADSSWKRKTTRRVRASRARASRSRNWARVRRAGRRNGQDPSEKGRGRSSTSTKRVSTRVTPAKSHAESSKDTEFIYSLAEDLIRTQTDFSKGVLRKDTEEVINQLNTRLNMKIDAEKISLKLFNSSPSLGFLELLENIRDFISNTREKLELHFFVLAKVLDKTKKNTLQTLEKYRLVDLTGANAMDQLEREDDARFEPIREEHFVSNAMKLLGLSEKNTRRIFKFLSAGHNRILVAELTSLIDQFRDNYHFRKYFEFERTMDARTKARRIVEVLDSAETEDFMAHFREQNLSMQDFGDLEGHLDRTGKVCLLDLRATIVEDMERHERTPDSRVIGRFLKACDLDSNGSIEVKEFVVLLHVAKLVRMLETPGGLRERKKEQLQARLEEFLGRDAGQGKKQPFHREKAFFWSVFKFDKNKWASSKSQEASFVREYNRKFQSNLEQFDRDASSVKATDRTDNTINEIRRLIDDEIFDGESPQGPKPKPDPGRSGRSQSERILDECNAVLKREGMTYQDVLDELDFDKDLDISVIKIRQYFKYKFGHEEDLRRMVKSLRFVDKNRNGSTNYMEILEFFTGTSKGLDVNPVKAIFLSNNLSGNFGNKIGGLIKSKNQKLLKHQLEKKLGQLSNKHDHQRLQNMSPTERMRLFADVLARHELTFEEVIDEMEYDQNLDVPLIKIKSYFREKIEDKKDTRLVICVLREMDTNSNGNVNYSEFIEFLQRLKRLQARGSRGSLEDVKMGANMETQTESPLNTGSCVGKAMHHRFKFDKTYKQSQFQKQICRRQDSASRGSQFRSLMRQASSHNQQFSDSVRQVVPHLERSGSHVITQNAEMALFKLHKLNAKELHDLKDSSDTVFACSSEIGFLGMRSLFEQAQIELSMAEALAVFKLIDDNQSHRICQSEFEQFIAKLMQEIQSEQSAVGYSAREDEKLMSTLQAELSRALFSKKSASGIESVKKSKFGGTQMRRFKSKLGKFAQQTLNAMSTINQSSINIFQELSKLENKSYKNFKYIFNSPFAALKACLDIMRELERTKTLHFSDPEFGPNEGDKFGARSIYFAETLPGYPQPEDINWLRPTEIAGQNVPICFLKDGASSNDVIQGSLGDCWFIGAMSVLAVKDEQIFHPLTEKLTGRGTSLSDEEAHQLLTGVYPSLFHNFSKFGLYVMRFFKDYDWRYVLIDSRLPCYGEANQDPQLVFASCENENEFWVPLIEKAYAKLHGNYAALISGVTDDGLVDMSGFVSEKVKVLDKRGQFNSKDLKSEDDFWRKMQKDLAAGSMMGCSIVGQSIEGEVIKDGEFTGLYSGHAYSILDAFEVGDNRLLKIRNPWGSGNPKEWTGAWSDNSEELIKHLPRINEVLRAKWGREAELLEEENKDGTFLMSFEDFTGTWHNLSICKKFSQAYSGLRFAGEFTEANSGGTPYRNDPEMFDSYLRNPQFIVQLQRKTHLFLSLGQEDGRVKSRGEEPFPFAKFIHPLSLTVFQLGRGSRQLNSFDQRAMKSRPFIKNYRDVQVDLVLEKGTYAVIPSTKLAGSHGKFFLNVYFDCAKDQIRVSNERDQFEQAPIEEEEETQIEVPKRLKQLLKAFVNEFHAHN